MAPVSEANRRNTEPLMLALEGRKASFRPRGLDPARDTARRHAARPIEGAGEARLAASATAKAVDWRRRKSE